MCQVFCQRVGEQNQTDVVRLQEKSINPVQKRSQISLYNTTIFDGVRFLKL